MNEAKKPFLPFDCARCDSEVCERRAICLRRRAVRPSTPYPVGLFFEAYGQDCPHFLEIPK